MGAGTAPPAHDVLVPLWDAWGDETGQIVPLAEARKRAAAARAMLAEGRDPIEERQRGARKQRAERKAATEARKEVEQKNRGFFDFGSSEPIVSRLKGDFAGFGKLHTQLAVINALDRSYELRDGSGIGVGAPQFGPRRGVYLTVSKDF